MVNEFKATFETLEGLSTKQLELSTENLARAEKRHVALLIAHIAEMSRRKAALECGYKNLFAYCVSRLKLSEGSVALRLQVANVSRRFPQLLVALAENRMSLTVAGHLAPHLREDNVDQLLGDCAGMTKREVEEYLVRLQPKPVFHPSIRKRPSSRKEKEKVSSEAQQETLRENQPANEPCPAPSAQDTTAQRPPSASSNLLQPARPDAYNFRFSADGSFKDKFERLAEVLGVENPLKNMAAVFEKALDISLDRKDPKRKLERRIERQRRRSAAREKSRPDEVATKGARPRVEQVEEIQDKEEAPSRYVPSQVRERVFARAGYQCQYRASDGTRCSSRTGLEIEHERPFALYRSHDERFLRALCHQHNALQAERVYGAGYIQAKIEQRKRQVAYRGRAPNSFTRDSFS